MPLGIFCGKKECLSSVWSDQINRYQYCSSFLLWAQENTYDFRDVSSVWKCRKWRFGDWCWLEIWKLRASVKRYDWSVSQLHRVKVSFDRFCVKCVGGATGLLCVLVGLFWCWLVVCYVYHLWWAVCVCFIVGLIIVVFVWGICVLYVFDLLFRKL